MTDTVDPRLQTRATELFGVRFPIVQTGMGWVAGASLVSGTANAGGLGILAAATMTFDEMVEAIERVKRIRMLKSSLKNVIKTQMV